MTDLIILGVGSNVFKEIGRTLRDNGHGDKITRLGTGRLVIDMRGVMLRNLDEDKLDDESEGDDGL